MAEKADLILTGGVVHTLDAAGTEATAVAVRGDTILAVGTDDEIERLAGQDAKRIPLAGATVVPGLVDSHLHVAAIGRMSRLALLFDARSIAEICDRLKEQAARTAGPVIGQGGNFHEASLAEGRLPTAADLDRVATDRPVMIGDVSKSIVNSFVLKGIDTRDVPQGGRVLESRSGRPLGIFLYAAKRMTPLAGQFAAGGEADPLPVAVEKGLRICAAFGLTGVLDGASGLDLIAAFRSLQERKALPIRVTMMPWATTPRALDGIGASPGGREGRLTFGPIKVFSGCFIMHKTALMYEPYEGEPEHRGTVKLPLAEMQRQITEAFTGGWPVGIHLAGDREIDLAAAQIERGIAKAGGQPGRSHMIHAYFPREKALSIAERLGLAWAVHPDFVRVWGDTVREFVGEKRAAHFTPMRTLLDRGLITGCGADAPSSASTRESRSAKPCGAIPPVRSAYSNRRMSAAQSSRGNWPTSPSSTGISCP